MSLYLCVLGRNHELSRSELQYFGTEVFSDSEKALSIMELNRFENPRNLPRQKEQLLLDRLGGVIRMAEIIGEFRSETELKQSIIRSIQNQKPEGKVHLGVSAWGCGRSFLKPFLSTLKQALKDQDRNCRIINIYGDNLDSGKIFGERLLQKGFEFIIWKRGDSYLLSQTCANQNLQNYTLRDRHKGFRDAQMGMLPPKLAQILLNIANPSWDDIVIDPFCGSGTVNIEAAIVGYSTLGSDIVEKHVVESQRNYNEMGEKFRYEVKGNEFFVSDVQKFPFSKYTNAVVVTEGTLGTNFHHRPTLNDIEKEKQSLIRLWKNVFGTMKDSSVSTVVFCLPAWFLHGKTVSIAHQVLQLAQDQGFVCEPVVSSSNTYIYARPGAFVGREICKVVRRS